MGTKLQNAAEAIKRLSASYQAVIDIASELERIGNIEAAENEAHRRLEQTRDDLKTVLSKLADARDDLMHATNAATEKVQIAQAEAAAILERARLQGLDMVSKAEQKADAELAAARNQASSIVSAAKSDAETIRKNSEASIAMDAEELAELREKLTETTQTLAARSATLAAVEKKLGEVHASVATLTRGAS